MFGYIIANRNQLSEEQYTRYRSYYCSLCRAIGERCGNPARLTLTYDMCFLLMLLDTLYKPEKQAGSERCAVRPFKKHGFEVSDVTRYCADMNVLLCYYSLLDQWNDERIGAAYATARCLHKKAMDISSQYPHQSEAIKTSLDELSKAESRGLLNPDVPAGLFGRLMAELFAIYEDEHAEALRTLGMALGRFIYIMDACVDFRGDLKRGRYNPLALMTTDSFEPMLCMLLGDCTERLRAVLPDESAVNFDILSNILYSGVWTRFNMTYKDKKSAGKAGENEDE